MIPAWLQRQLEATGRWNTDNVSRSLSAGRCRRCHAQVVRALDNDIAGIPATCDPQTIDPIGEVLALVAGRSTYTVHRGAGRWELSHRHQWLIAAGKPALVLAQHLCHAPPLPPGQPLPAPAHRIDNGEVPF